MLEASIRREHDDLVEYVMHRHGNAIWRFRITEGVFYAVIGAHDGRCITLLTQAMIRGYKRGDRIMQATRKAKRKPKPPPKASSASS